MAQTRAERVEARITQEQKRLFRKAAAVQGRSLSDFLVTAAVEAAQKVIQERESIRLSQKDRELFVKTLIQSPAPNKKLKAAAKWYKKEGNA